MILRTNISNVIEELRPIVERARSNTGNIMSGNNNGNMSLASWLSTTHQSAVTAPSRENNSSTSTGAFQNLELISQKYNESSLHAKIMLFL